MPVHHPKLLIDELHQLAPKFQVLSLIVGFATETRYVHSTMTDGLEKLIGWSNEGGQPIGFMGCRNPPQCRPEIHIWLLKEYESDARFRREMDNFVNYFTRAGLPSHKFKFVINLSENN